jgi:hypothetical protein
MIVELSMDTNSDVHDAAEVRVTAAHQCGRVLKLWKI